MAGDDVSRPIVLVTGGRDYADRARVFAELDAIHAKTPIRFMYEGGALGADQLAHAWRLSRHVAGRTVYPDWKQHGRKAGPIRNADMLREAMASAEAERVGLVVVAFPGGIGTADMVAKAEAKGVDVRVIA